MARKEWTDMVGERHGRLVGLAFLATALQARP
jgi:hypothetical protein